MEGRRYVDFAGGIAVLNVGHRHPKVLDAVRAQLDRFTHTAFQVSAYEPYIALAEKLNVLAPFEGPAKTIFFSTGRRSDRECGQDRARGNGAQRHHRLYRRVSWPHAPGLGHDRQDQALQGPLRYAAR